MVLSGVEVDDGDVGRLVLVGCHRRADGNLCRTQIFDENVSPKFGGEAAAANRRHLKEGLQVSYLKNSRHFYN
jgi:hypothetical protein